MKNLLTLAIIALMSITTFAQSNSIVLQSNSTKQSCTKENFTGFNAVFSFEKIDALTVNTEKGNFSEISIEGAFPSGFEGTPQLPAFHKLIAIPQGASPTVIVKSYTETEYNLADYGWDKIYPQQPSVRKDMKPEDVKFVYQESAYSARGYDQREIAVVEEMGVMRNIRVGSLAINPIVYDAGNNTIKVRNDIEIEVVFEGADKAATQSLFEATYSPYFSPIYKAFLNINSVYDDHPDLYNTPVHMLVIANRMFEETLQPWILWKTQKGFYVDVNYTDNIGTTYAEIRSFVVNKYNAGLANGAAPTFLVLVGDTPQLPSTNGSSTSKVTDLYYASVDSDYFPEMYGSRMSCATTTELASLIEKILVYEKDLAEDRSYLGNTLLIAGQDGTYNPIFARPTINYGTQNFFNSAHGYNNVYAYLTSYNNCYSHLSEGVAFANYTAHGSETSWAGPSFSVSQVAGLTNTNKYFLAIGNCCLAANFGYSQVCFAEAMIRAHQKGAYSYIGSCPNTYWDEDYYWSVGATTIKSNPPLPSQTTLGAYEAAFMPNVYNTVASSMFVGNLAVTHARSCGYSYSVQPQYYWQAYHVLGDGSIMPHYGMPTDNIVSHEASIGLNLDSFEISAVPGSYAAISKDGVLHGVAVVGASGTVQVPLNIPITSEGNVDIVVTCPQKFPYITTIPTAVDDDDCYDIIIGTGTTASYKIPVNMMYRYSYTQQIFDAQEIGISAGEIFSISFQYVTQHITPKDPISIYMGNTSKSSFESTADWLPFSALQEVVAPREVFFSDPGDEHWFSFNFETPFIYTGENIVVAVLNNAGQYYPNGNTPFLIHPTTENKTLHYRVDGSVTINPVTVAPATEMMTSRNNVKFFACETLGTFACDSPTNFVAVVEDYNDVHLSWTAPNTNPYTTVVAYNLYRDDEAIPFTTLEPALTSYSEENLNTEGTYCYSIKALWSHGCESEATNIECVDVSAKMRIVTGTVRDACTNTNIFAIVRFDAGNECATTAMGEYSITLPKDAIYDVEFSAANYVTHTEMGFVVDADKVLDASLEPLFLDPVINLSAHVDGMLASLIWEVPGAKCAGEIAAESYDIYRDDVKIDNVAPTITMYQDEMHADTHVYCVVAVYAYGESSEECVLAYSGGGIQTFPALKVYPNPADNTVKIEGKDIASVTVYNSIGQHVAEYKGVSTIDISSYNTGIYLFNIATKDGKVERVKVVVAR